MTRRGSVHCWVALLRGINVGGRNRLAMADLRRCFESAGATNVRTYIQSGNVVFDCVDAAAGGVAQTAARKIRQAHGFEPGIQLIGAAALDRIAARNPFPDAVREPATVHVLFLSESLTEPQRVGAEAALAELRAASESFVLFADVLFLHAPDGIARSRLAGRTEQVLGVATTARNWRTVGKLIELSRPG